MTRGLGRRTALAAGLLVAAATAAAFLPALRNGFVDYDDYQYLLENPAVQGGLSLQGVLWAFRAFAAGNWHPITWISHMADVQLFGFAPAGHHFTSLAIHTLATLAFFLALRRMTGCVWRSAAAAALFGVHPLRVESVAWASERKDVLCGLFWMLTLLAHARHAARPGPARYLLVLASCSVALLAKPMAVSLPLVLLLLDWWPLGRIGPGRAPGGRVLLEKVPLLALSAGSAAATYLAQREGGTMYLMSAVPLAARLATALVNAARYLGKALLPLDLACIYPHAGASPGAWQTAGAALLLLGISAVAARERRRRVYLAVGWLWYLVTLVPVSGVVQVGFQAIADRYTYLPLAGPFLAVCWFAGEGLARRPALRPLAAALAVAVTGSLMALSWRQTAVWRDSITLFRHAVAVVPDNWPAHHYLGNALLAEGRAEEAASHYLAALRVNPGHPDSWDMLGRAYTELGQLPQALAALERALALNPAFAEAHYDLGRALGRLGRAEESLQAYARAVRLKPAFPEALYNLGLAHLGRGDLGSAQQAARSLQAVDPVLAARLGRLISLTARPGR